MGLRPGYKRTEIGVIPEDWDVRTVGEIARFSSGCGISVSGLRDYSPDCPVPVFGGNGIAGFTTTAIVRDSTVVIGRVGQRCGEVQLTHGPAWISDNALYPKRMVLDCDVQFFALALSAAGLNSVKNRNDLPLLTQSILHAVKLPWPPSPHEQRAVAVTLGDMESLLNGMDCLIAKTRDLKQAVMQQLLTGKTRLPGFTGEWEVKRLGDVVEIKKGKLITERGIVPGSVPVIAGGKLPAYFHDKCNRTGKTITISASGASAGYVSFYSVPIFASDCSTISEGPDYCIDFIYFLLLSQQERIYRAQTGGAQPHVHPADLSPLEFSMPDRAEQTAIATILSDIDAEIAAREALRDKTRALKQAMMQDLLTGRKRLVKPTAQVIPLATAKKVETAKPGHNEHFNEAVVIATLAQRFAGEDYPLGRFRYTKLSYLLHKHAERNTDQYLRKAAGPYNPKTRYGGAEKIALAKHYVREHHAGKYAGFVADGNVTEAEGYFREWYGDEVLSWLEQFRKTSNDDLELFTTIFGAIDGVAKAGGAPSFKSVKQFIADDPEWRAKLKRPLFSDDNIVRAGRKYRDLFGEPPAATPPT